MTDDARGRKLSLSQAGQTVSVYTFDFFHRFFAQASGVMCKWHANGDPLVEARLAAAMRAVNRPEAMAYSAWRPHAKRDRMNSGRPSVCGDRGLGAA